ncbi:MAG: BlaI/MecI/CopY family transcriptional regulator [Hymenobacter sp.]
MSTIVRILEQKGFVGYEPVGRGYRYHALVAQDDYRRFSLRKLLRGYFGGSFGQLVPFLPRMKTWMPPSSIPCCARPKRAKRPRRTTKKVSIKRS